MKKIYILIVLVLLAAFAAGIVMLLKKNTPTTQQQTQTPPPPAATSNKSGPPAGTPPSKTENTIKTNILVEKKTDSKLGTYLVDNKGMALYAYAQDKNLESTCYDDCLQNWSPYLFTGQVDVKQVKDQLHGLLNFFERKDGSVQIAYGTRPLYYYTKDGAGSPTGVSQQWSLILLKP